jgi:riboflavin synthase
VFTGLIREMATVQSFSGEKLTLKATYRPGIGDSIAVNGACLTVTELTGGGFSVELSHESQKLLAVENYTGRVHMEPAMRLSDRFEGHVVQGHVDAIGTIDRVEKTGKSWDFWIAAPAEAMPLIAPKGSIAVDGVSLTVNTVEADRFRLTLIPHSLKNTLFETCTPGRRVNLETDLFARYLQRLMGADRTSLTWDQADRMMALY